MYDHGDRPAESLINEHVNGQTRLLSVAVAKLAHSLCYFISFSFCYGGSFLKIVWPELRANGERRRRDT